MCSVNYANIKKKDSMIPIITFVDFFKVKHMSYQFLIRVISVIMLKNKKLNESSANNQNGAAMSQLSTIMHLAEALAYFSERERALDEEEIGESSPAYMDELLKRRQNNLRAIEGVEQALSTIRAETLSEAAIQVMIAAARVRAFADEIDGDSDTRDALRTIDDLLYSALPALERLTDGLRRYQPARYGFRSSSPGERQNPGSRGE